MNEQEIFIAALELPDARRRQEFIEHACAGDRALREQVESLLAAHGRPGEFLDVPVCEQLGASPVRLATSNEQPMNQRHKDQALDTEALPIEGESEESSLDFLQPSTKPESLGRLAHYEVLEVLGKGGFGTVLKAFDEKLHRMVAIKIMSRKMASTSPARKRFLREARSSAAIRHENVVDIHAIEEQPVPFLVMEYVAGETLQERLDREGPLDALETARVGVQIAEGLAAAHAMGKIHRDIKPANILIEEGSRRVKITDFGLARAADDASLTQSGYIAGTPMYMSPEQALGAAVDHRTDLFSLGSVLYVMCSGRPPFRASSSLAVMKRVAEDPPRPLREIIPEVPEWLSDVIVKLHAKSPGERFQSAKEVAQLLQGCLAGMQPTDRVQSVIPSLAPAGKSPAATLPAPVAAEQKRPLKRRLIIAAIILIPILAGFFLREWTGMTNVRGYLARLFRQNAGGVTANESGDSSSSAASPTAGSEELSLFNGHDLSGWRVLGKNGWAIADNVLVGSSEEQLGFLMTEQEFTDYDLAFECRISAGGDSGVFLRAWPSANLLGRDFIELQLIDNKVITDTFGELIAARQHGALLGIAAPDPAVPPVIDSWQHVRVRVAGKQVQVWLDYRQVIDAIVASLPDRGKIALQLSLGKVEFRNIRVRAAH
jgi:serine/threonine protein kinase